MLKGIDPLLSGDLLKILDDMGHGDRLLLVDRNYPAASSGKPVVRLGEVSIIRAATAILSVFPLDSFIDHPLERMVVEGDPVKTTQTQDDLLVEFCEVAKPEQKILTKFFKTPPNEIKAALRRLKAAGRLVEATKNGKTTYEARKS